MTSPHAIEGVLALLPTPFDALGELDLAAWRSNISALAAVGMHGIVVASGIGESYALDDAEFKQLVDSAVSVSGDMLCIVNCSYQNMAKTVERCQYAERAGVTYVMIYPYHYVEARFDAETYLRWLSNIHSATRTTQFIILNDYRETKTKILSWELYSRIFSRFDRICACVEDVGNVSEESIIALSHCFASFGDKVRFMTRSEADMMVGIALGAKGCLATYGLAMPELLLELHDACRNGRWDTALQLHQRLTRFPWKSGCVGANLPGLPSVLYPGTFVTSIGNTHVIAGQKVGSIFPGTPTISKAMSVAAGRLVGDVRMPTCSSTQAMAKFCRAWLEDIARADEERPVEQS